MRCGVDKMKAIGLFLTLGIVISLFLIAGCSSNTADKNIGDVNANSAVQQPDVNKSAGEVASAESVITFQVLDKNKTGGNNESI